MGSIDSRASCPLLDPLASPSRAPLEGEFCPLHESPLGVVGRLETLVREQEAILRQQADALAEGRRSFERASAAARIGFWECRLADNVLTWSDMVYDLFDIPQGSSLDRAKTVEYYSPASKEALNALRSQAIAQRSGFSLDAEIITPKGRHRWIRLTATVESDRGDDGRIFGMKQDITEEKIRADRTRFMAEFDCMTGLANRHRFQDRLSASQSDPAAALGALLLVDLDGFKQVNDTFGHALGDACLIEMAARLAKECNGAELVARIGGDEFAVLIGPDLSDLVVAGYAARIVHALSQPVKTADATVAMSASVGIAYVRGCQPSELFRNADSALYAAKAAGRNTFRFFRQAR
ncbi:hypothetical protein Sa4125_28240 [Aureimonas sp. SA4125]|uniref:diguanylate cyclase domain-containing protein n=1 Tax=Aureimonas sp. SA4125 TaxID=2826993 RepID=UPI001CC37C1D|nr:diguanylate cyclase [Aureimonas sp. SA4125]BDA85282.1 hypothetical protein Sa4125_28240 [Aureimonas sp. SA4125]